MPDIEALVQYDPKLAAPAVTGMRKSLAAVRKAARKTEGLANELLRVIELPPDDDNLLRLERMAHEAFEVTHDAGTIAHWAQEAIFDLARDAYYREKHRVEAAQEQVAQTARDEAILAAAREVEERRSRSAGEVSAPAGGMARVPRGNRRLSAGGRQL